MYVMYKNRLIPGTQQFDLYEGQETRYVLLRMLLVVGTFYSLYVNYSERARNNTRYTYLNSFLIILFLELRVGGFD